MAIKFIPPSGFDTKKHRQYVESGGCPYVEGKTWCNGRNTDGHQDHYALRFHPNNQVTKVKFNRAHRAQY